MKKIIILYTSVVFCSQVFASDENFYIKAGGFGSIANKILSSAFIDEIQNSNRKTSIENPTSNKGFGAYIASGYQINEKIRIEAQCSYLFDQKWRTSKKQETITYIKTIPSVIEAKGGIFINGTNFGTKISSDEGTNVSKKKIEEKEITISVSGPVAFLNLYADIINIGKTKIYIGGGVGVSCMKTILEMDKSKVSEQKTNFAWNVGAGMGFEVSPFVIIDVGYSFNDLGVPSKSKNDKVFESIKAQNINVGVRFLF